MNAELAKKRIASYLRGNITKEELDEFINGFGNDLTEEAYTEILNEEFEKFIADDNSDESDLKNIEAANATSQTEQKKGKTTQPRRFMHRNGFTFSVKAAALCIFTFNFLRRFFSFPAC